MDGGFAEVMVVCGRVEWCWGKWERAVYDGLRHTAAMSLNHAICGPFAIEKNILV